MALKLIVTVTSSLSGFGPIQNYMALKPTIYYDGGKDSFGPIQNYMALKLQYSAFTQHYKFWSYSKLHGSKTSEPVLSSATRFAHSRFE